MNIDEILNEIKLLIEYPDAQPVEFKSSITVSLPIAYIENPDVFAICNNIEDPTPLSQACK